MNSSNSVYRNLAHRRFLKNHRRFMIETAEYLSENSFKAILDIQCLWIALLPSIWNTNATYSYYTVTLYTILIYKKNVYHDTKLRYNQSNDQRKDLTNDLNSIAMSTMRIKKVLRYFPPNKIMSKDDVSCPTTKNLYFLTQKFLWHL